MLSIKKITGVLVLSLIFYGFSLLSGPVLRTSADSCDTNGDGQVSTQEAIQCGSNGAAGTTQTSAQAPKNIDDTIASIVNILSSVVGVIAVIMIVMGGFRYITSGGQAEKITQAKNSLMYAIIGLIIVALAQVIARFTLHTVTNSAGNSSQVCSINPSTHTQVCQP